MEKRKLLLLSILFSFVFVYMGCKESTTEPPVDPPAINESEILATYLEANNDYIHNGVSFVVGAADVRTSINTNPTKQLIVDIRAAADYNAKRLKGAINKPLADLNTYFKTLTLASYDRIVLVCYSGQTSAYATGLMRAMGYGNKVVSLKFGMSSIDSSFAQNYWLTKVGNLANFVQTASPAKNAPVALAKIVTGKTTGAEILSARVDTLLKIGFTPATISYATLAQGFSNYYIANYWESTLYLDPGHLDGAINYVPSLKPFQHSKELKTLPTNKPTVVYCFTGQTSAYVATYLRLIGYDARTLTYGANGMIYNIMVAKNVANTFLPLVEIKGYKDILEP